MLYQSACSILSSWVSWMEPELYPIAGHQALMRNCSRSHNRPRSGDRLTGLTRQLEQKRVSRGVATTNQTEEQGKQAVLSCAETKLIVENFQRNRKV